MVLFDRGRVQTGSTWDAIRSLRAANAPAPSYAAPGARFVTAHGCVHLEVLGDPHPGAPTVVLEAPLGAATPVWAWVLPAVARFARVIAYDRAGLGGSDELPAGEGTSAQFEALAEALHAVAGRGPYVIVAHSYGGLVARESLATMDARFAGAVLVEPSHPEQFGKDSPLPVDTVERFRMQLERLGGVAGENVATAPSTLLTGLLRGLPLEARRRLESAFAADAHLANAAREARAWDATCARVSALPDLGDLPLTVLSGMDGSPQVVRALASMHAEIARLSSRGRCVRVPGTHRSLVTYRDHARVVVAAVQDLMRPRFLRAA